MKQKVSIGDPESQAPELRQILEEEQTMSSPLHGRESLCRLSDANYEVAPGEHDVRGWKVVLPDDVRIGRVDDLIIAEGAGKVRYLDVNLDRKAVGLSRDRHVLIPIASAQLDPDDKCVVLSGMTRPALLALPDYTGTAFDGRYDTEYGSQLKPEQISKRLTRSAEELRIGKRVAKSGEVRVSKHVETEHVKKDVPLTREEVHVERRPVEHAVGRTPEFRNDEIVVPIVEEEVIVEKRPVVKEEIVISKQPVTKRETIETDLRHEEFDVERSSGDVRVKKDKTPGGR
jgi:uncharacterized protein (TIGR02271 family)